jgi:hypothetical protein
MLSRNKRTRVRARAWLQTKTPPPPDDGTLQRIEEEAAAIVHEDPSRPEALVARTINDVSESYYEYLLTRWRRPKPRDTNDRCAAHRLDTVGGGLRCRHPDRSWTGPAHGHQMQ